MIPFTQDSFDLLVYDFDGVMTDNRALVTETGEEAVFVNRSDGLAIKMMKKQGIKQIILSTEVNPVVAMRAKKLGLEVIHGVENKKSALETYLKQHQIRPEKVLFIGNDLNDLEVMSWVGLPMTPEDGYPCIKKISKHVFRTKGGYGVIRELYSLLFGQ